MTDIKLPAGYADWVARGGHQPLRPPYLRVTFERVNATGASGEVVEVRWLMPPKPKPTLPDVKPGAVISFKSRILGVTRRAIRTSDYQWRVFDHGTPVVYCGNDWVDPKATDEQLLEAVDADGFKVELA